MPIYAYRCTACGHAKDVLQRISDPLLVTCPACCADTFAKQVTAAGFQLKGSGWYVTDFRGGNTAAPAAEAAPAAAASEGTADNKAAAKPAAEAPAAATPAAPASPAKPATPAASGS